MDAQTTFKFAELSEAAKRRAIDWYRESDDWEPNREDVAQTFGWLGFTVSPDDFNYSIGFCQGDYATFSGAWKAADMDYGKLLEERPGDELLRIVGAALMRVFLACPEASADIKAQSDRVRLSVEEALAHPDDTDTNPFVEETVQNAARDLEKWLYHCWSEELLARGTDEACIEGIEGNEYDFDEDGEPA